MTEQAYFEQFVGDVDVPEHIQRRVVTREIHHRHTDLKIQERWDSHLDEWVVVVVDYGASGRHVARDIAIMYALEAWDDLMTTDRILGIKKKE